METKTKHLTVGSPEPPKADGLRLYSFEFCPYAHRVRLVLHAKNLKYEAVNINLTSKPEWYSSINPSEKVPALDTGNEIVTESLVIANYLNDKYPLPALYPAEPAAVKKEQELIEKTGYLTSLFYKCLVNPNEKSVEEWVKDFLIGMEPFENELKARGTPYFGGEQPGMVDYMLWPWAERSKTLSMVLHEKLPFADDEISSLIMWQKNMRTQPAVQAIYNGPEKFYKYVLLRNQENPDFDSI
ncbi:hypothetical protein WA026_019012 [Henosepilachna vigintioctopunctata]|uniref:Uncharacterized protein n=1 Tax=Henosepilachna vigintioctopunctata TaxID=420089 RepID=A0AAW1VAJ6_9CUCU